MARLNHLLMGVAVILGCMFLSQMLVWVYLPDTGDPTNQHPMIAIPTTTRDLIKDKPFKVSKIASVQRSQQQLKLEDKQQQQQQHQSGHGRVKTHQIHREKPAVPTANTISPYLKHPLFEGKERLLTMLHEAHYFNDSAPEFFKDEAKVQSLSEKLPTWKTITDRLGGEKPALVGLDTCEAFRAKVPPAERFIGVAGLFATATNLLASLFVSNCRNDARMKEFSGTGVRWQVNWGKHSLARYRLDNHIDPSLNNDNFLPVVTTRHPYSWMQSLCRQRYSTHWFHNAQEHCPNLVPNDIDRKWYNFTVKYKKQGVHELFQDPWFRDNLLDFANFTLNSTVVPVRVRYKSGTLFHESLAHMWNEWYHEYIDADFPRIVVRLEDLVFHSKEVITDICNCIGGKMQKDFQYVTQTAKVGDDNIHGKAEDRTNMFKWFTKWHLENRTKNMTREDHAYATEHLDSKLLDLFRYTPAPPEDV